MTTPQRPLGSGFGPATTAQEALAGRDLSGKTIVVTGGYSGLGQEVVRVLSGAGADIVVPARDVARAREALAGFSNVDVRDMDLNDPESITAFADGFLQAGKPLDILINSAGVMATPLTRDAQGHEGQLSTNHLGHFRLTARLWPALAAAGQGQGARVVAFSSGGHQIAPVDFDDPNFERRPYDKWAAYGQSKTANVLFAVELDRRAAALGVRAFSLHPGTVLGPLARHLTQEEIATFNVHDADGSVIVDPDRDLKTVEQGAATAVWCATSLLLKGMGGVYCENCDIALPQSAKQDGPGHGVKDWATRPENASRLWALSEAMTKTTFDPAADRSAA